MDELENISIDDFFTFGQMSTSGLDGDSSDGGTMSIDLPTIGGGSGDTDGSPNTKGNSTTDILGKVIDIIKESQKVITTVGDVVKGPKKPSEAPHLDDIPVVVPTGGKPAPPEEKKESPESDKPSTESTPATAIDDTRDKVRAALEKLRRSS